MQTNNKSTCLLHAVFHESHRQKTKRKPNGSGALANVEKNANVSVSFFLKRHWHCAASLLVLSQGGLINQTQAVCKLELESRFSEMFSVVIIVCFECTRAKGLSYFVPKVFGVMQSLRFCYCSSNIDGYRVGKTKKYYFLIIISWLVCDLFTIRQYLVITEL